VQGLAELSIISKQQKLTTEVDPELSVFADKDMIATVLRNLVFNAVKFSPKGSEILVRAQMLGSHVRIDVVDHGVGISPELLDRLFEVGKATTSFGTEGESGTGLGLAICHEFVKKNGGHLQVESKVGQGSVFSFTILKSDIDQV